MCVHALTHIRSVSVIGTAMAYQEGGPPRPLALTVFLMLPSKHPLSTRVVGDGDVSLRMSTRYSLTLSILTSQVSLH